MLKVRPHTKSGGGAAQSTSGPIRKVGGRSPLQVRYTKSGGGEGGGGGGGSPLQVRYLCLAHVIVNNERLQF